MAFDFVSSFFTSAAWMRIVMDAFLLVPFLLTTQRFVVPFAKGLRLIPVILLGRDFLSFLVLHPFVFLVSDAALAIILFFWVASYNVKLINPYIPSLVTGLGTIILSIVHFSSGNSSVITVISQLFMLGMHLWVGLLMFRFSIYNSTNTEFLMDNRLLFTVFLVVSRFLIALEPSVRSPISQYVLYTFYLIPFFYLIVSYILFFNKKFEERESYNVSYINSLFDFLRTISNAMTEKIEVKNILAYIVKSVTQYITADAGAVLLKDTSEGTLNLAAVEGYFPPPFEVPAIVKTKLTGVQKFFENTPINLGETVFGEAAQKNIPIFIRKSFEDPRMKANTKDDTLIISSIIVIPVVVNKEVFGVIGLIRRKKDALFNETEFERARVFVEYASLTLDSLSNYAQLLEKQEIEREVNIAASIQKKLLPSRIPKVISGMVHAYSRPAKGVSGDYYDIIPLSATGKFAMVICDVAGKGVPASLIMVMIRTIIHTIGGARKNAAEVMGWINRGIAGSIDIERFATMSYLTYNPQDHLIEYSNAGHHPLMLYRQASDIIERVDSPGLPIGLERDSQYTLVRLNIEPGDIILAYTDGIIEAMNYRGEQYEEERLKTVFKENRHKSAKDIIDAIREAVDTFVGQAKQHDDMTLIVLKAQ